METIQIRLCIMSSVIWVLAVYGLYAPSPPPPPPPTHTPLIPTPNVWVVPQEEVQYSMILLVDSEGPPDQMGKLI